MKHLLCLSFLAILTYSSLHAQSLVEDGENVVYRCQLERGQILVLVEDTVHDYLVCRLGNENQVEFEFPDRSEHSWNEFHYQHYLRGGGAENEALDLNYVHFNKKNQRYTIYQEYSAVDDRETCGLRISDLRSGDESEYPGIASLQGSLIEFRFNGKLAE